jgi:peroxiredoxin
MLVNKEHLGFGHRSWRYSALIKNGAVMKMFVEPGKNDKGDDMDPFEVSDVDTMLAYLKG